MVKKLKFKKFQINFSNKLFYTLVSIGIFIAIGIGVYAYGGSQPSVFGHSAGELELPEGVIVPSGVIVMWSGTLATIPAGWALCDGTSGTPDLRDRFVYGPSADENPGATGGASSYTLTTAQLPSHSHTISSDGAHTHNIRGNTGEPSADTAAVDSIETVQYLEKWNVGLISEAGSHSHGGATGSTGSGASIDNRPSYYKLAFIMKL